ncbi:hypothetical protein MMC06_003358 [Schaereria dolodes]|nr:hypothetical protein [Schaereria dolodes]
MHLHQMTEGKLLTTDNTCRETSVIIEHSAPITIPTPRQRISRPTTPLTGRTEENEGHQFPFADQTSQKLSVSHSLELTYQHNPPTTNTPTTPPKPLRKPNSFKKQIFSEFLAMMRQDQASPLYTPSSPLSPTMPSSTLSSNNQRNSRRVPPNLQNPSLGRFHPVNFQSTDASLAITSNRTRPPSAIGQPRSPQRRQRHGSDAQRKLHQYQRELIKNATRTSISIATPTSGVNPKTPQLVPCRSPGPTTPLMLEEGSDYLTAGSNGLQSVLGEGSPRALVDELIRKETERRVYPGAHDGRCSPAVSPAGGRF